MEWPVEAFVICQLRNKTEKKGHFPIEYEKCLQPGTNICHYSPKSRIHGSENQRPEWLIPLKKFFIPCFATNLELSGFRLLIPQERNTCTRRHNQRSIKLEVRIYLLSLALVTNYHKCSVLKQHKFIIL